MAGSYQELEASRSEQRQRLEETRFPDGTTVAIHMVHMNHLDLTWYWGLRDTFEMCLQTIRWHVALLEQHRDATCTHAQVFTLRVVEELDPGLFQRFAALVRDGRIEVDSGEVVEADHNLPCGESLARQLLYGQRYLRRKFGRIARTMVNSDSFGHARSLPQVLAKAGIAGFLFKRPTQEDLALPETPFLWEGIDGTRIPALRFVNKGNGLPRMSWGPGFQPVLQPGEREIQVKVDRNHAIGCHHLFASHCNSDAGGVTAYLPPLEGHGFRLSYGTPTGFITAMLAERPDLPVRHGILNFQYTGCYTTHIEEKEHCRQAEAAFRATELLATLATMAGQGYPAKTLEECWWRFCYLQFHDVLTGTGSHEAHRDSASHYHEILLILHQLARRAEIAIERATPSPVSAAPTEVCTVLVCHARPSIADEIVRLDVDLRTPSIDGLGDFAPDCGELADGTGRRVPWQVIDRRERQRFVHGTMLVHARSLPPLGLQIYRPVEGGPPATDLRVEGSSIENAFLRIEVGPPGIIRSIVTRRDGRERLADGEAPVAFEAWPETLPTDMMAWKLMNTDHREDLAFLDGPTVIERGPVRATIRIAHRRGRSTFTTDVSLYAGQEWVELRTTIDWQEIDTLVRLRVTPHLAGPRECTYGIPFGFERATGSEAEIPAVGWSDLSGGGHGISLLDRDRPGRTFIGDALRISVVRASSGPFDARSDEGIIEAAFRLVPHDGDGWIADIQRQSDTFSFPSPAWQSQTPTGVAGSSTPILEVTGEGVRTSCFKVAEDGTGIVLRLYEAMGKDCTARIIPGHLLAGLQLREVDLLEGTSPPPADRGPIVRDGTVELRFRAFEIRTLLFETAIPLPESPAGGCWKKEVGT